MVAAAAAAAAAGEHIGPQVEAAVARVLAAEEESERYCVIDTGVGAAVAGGTDLVVAFV